VIDQLNKDSKNSVESMAQASELIHSSESLADNVSEIFDELEAMMKQAQTDNQTDRGQFAQLSMRFEALMAQNQEQRKVIAHLQEIDGLLNDATDTINHNLNQFKWQ